MKAFKIDKLPTNPNGMVFIGFDTVMIVQKRSMLAVYVPVSELHNNLSVGFVKRVEDDLLMNGYYEDKSYHISIYNSNESSLN